MQNFQAIEINKNCLERKKMKINIENISFSRYGSFLSVSYYKEEKEIGKQSDVVVVQARLDKANTRLTTLIAMRADGEITKDFPVTSRLKKAKPVYVTMPGFKCDIRGIREFDKLPKEAQDYVLFIEKEIGVPIKLVSNGPRREEIIVR